MRLFTLCTLICMFYTLSAHSKMVYSTGIEPITLSSNCWLGWCDYSFVLNHTTIPAFRNDFLNMVTRVEELQLSNSSDLHKKYFGTEQLGLVYLKWINQKISEVGYQFYEKPTIYASVDSLWLLPDYVVFTNATDSLNSMMVFAIFIHEAKHGGYNSSGFPHSLCRQKKNSDQWESSLATEGAIAACDTEIDSSFGITYITMCNIANYCTNCTREEVNQSVEAASLAINRVVSEETQSLLQLDCRLNSLYEKQSPSFSRNSRPPSQ